MKMEDVMRAYQAAATAVGLSFLLAMTGGAFAATSSSDMQGNQGPAIGTTSGPAAGNNVSTGDESAQNQEKKSEQQSGAPGVAGKPGGKNGPAQQPSDKD
jgi:predicted lipid-binding transport protein (Tim44 family)